jgi:hypothetical protein
LFCQGSRTKSSPQIAVAIVKIPPIPESPPNRKADSWNHIRIPQRNRFFDGW